MIRDDDDLEKHVAYLHYNPVKHGHVDQASAWPYSSIHKFIAQGMLDVDWSDTARAIDLPEFD